MPNIIEQQDLLKGLPNTRLAMLLQNPTGDIPLFLVAAEAQRRQALAQQFAGSEGEESVVDTLTKQLANVPQNIPAPTRSPPMVPQTPQMQGVAALQAQQAVQQMAQPQEMRAGGMVQRYNNGALVQASSGAPAGGFYSPAPSSTAESMARTYMFLNPGMTYEEALQRAGVGAALPRPTVGDLAAAAAGRISSEMGGVGNYSILRKPSERQEQPAITEKAEGTEPASDTGKNRIFPSLPAGASGGMSLTTPPKAAAAPVETPPPEPGETPDEYRARLEEILSVQELSNSEKAGKYYDMAAAFLDPSKTTMESIAAAGQAFSRASAEQARAEREAKIALERGLLEYDISQSEGKRDREAKRSESQISSLQYQGEQAMKTAELHDRLVREAERELADYQKALGENVLLTPEQRANDPGLVALKQRIKDANAAKNAALAASAMFQRKYGEAYGTYSKTPYWDGEKLVYPQ